MKRVINRGGSLTEVGTMLAIILLLAGCFHTYGLPEPTTNPEYEGTTQPLGGAVAFCDRNPEDVRC